MRRCAVMLLVACSCKSPPAVPDAGTVVERGTDLRSAITTIFPEYRGAQMMHGRVQLSRTSGPATKADLQKALEGAKLSGFEGEPPTRAPFTLEQRLEGAELHQELRMAFSPEELGRIVSAPAAMTSEAMAHWMPKVAPRTAEDLDVELIWAAQNVARADFLVWQLTDGALAQGWTADALPSGFHRGRVDGGVVVPEEFSLTLRNAHSGSVIEVERRRERAKLRYRLVTFERR